MKPPGRSKRMYPYIHAPGTAYFDYGCWNPSRLTGASWPTVECITRCSYLVVPVDVMDGAL